MPTMTTVLVTSSVTLIYGAQGSQASPLTVINLDPVNTVYIGNAQNIQAGAPGVLPLLPGGSISFDGSVSVYGVTSNAQVKIAVTPGGVSYSPGTSVQPIYQMGGTTGPNAFTVPGNGLFPVFTLIPVSQFNSYDLSAYIYDTAQATAGHALNLQVIIQFFDDTVSGVPVFQEEWYPWVGSVAIGGGFFNQTNVTATGPMHGQYMSMTVYNNGNAGVNFQYLNVFGSPRVMQLSDWRQNVNINHPIDTTLHYAAPAGYPPADSFDNKLLDFQGNLSSGLSYFAPLGLYSGPVSIIFSNGATQTSNPLLVDMSGYNTNGIPTTFPHTGIVWEFGLNTGVQTVNGLNLPRACCALIIPNAVAGSTSCKITAQQGP